MRITPRAHHHTYLVAHCDCIVVSTLRCITSSFLLIYCHVCRYGRYMRLNASNLKKASWYNPNVFTLTKVPLLLHPKESFLYRLQPLTVQLQFYYICRVLIPFCTILILIKRGRKFHTSYLVSLYFVSYLGKLCLATLTSTFCLLSQNHVALDISIIPYMSHIINIVHLFSRCAYFIYALLLKVKWG